MYHAIDDMEHQQPQLDVEPPLKDYWCCVKLLDRCLCGYSLLIGVQLAAVADILVGIVVIGIMNEEKSDSHGNYDTGTLDQFATFNAIAGLVMGGLAIRASEKAKGDIILLYCLWYTYKTVAFFLISLAQRYDFCQNCLDYKENCEQDCSNGIAVFFVGLIVIFFVELYFAFVILSYGIRVQAGQIFLCHRGPAARDDGSFELPSSGFSVGW